jgi:hypothetical protein
VRREEGETASIFVFIVNQMGENGIMSCKEQIINVVIPREVRRGMRRRKQ